MADTLSNGLLARGKDCKLRTHLLNAKIGREASREAEAFIKTHENKKADLEVQNRQRQGIISWRLTPFL